MRCNVQPNRFNPRNCFFFIFLQKIYAAWQFSSYLLWKGILSVQFIPDLTICSGLVFFFAFTEVHRALCRNGCLFFYSNHDHNVMIGMSPSGKKPGL